MFIAIFAIVRSWIGAIINSGMIYEPRVPSRLLVVNGRTRSQSTYPEETGVSDRCKDMLIRNNMTYCVAKVQDISDCCVFIVQSNIAN